VKEISQNISPAAAMFSAGSKPLINLNGVPKLWALQLEDVFL